MTNEEWTQWFRAELRRLGLTRSEVARRLGVEVSMVMDWEHCRSIAHAPSEKTKARIADIFGVQPTPNNVVSINSKRKS